MKQKHQLQISHTEIVTVSSAEVEKTRVSYDC